MSKLYYENIKDDILASNENYVNSQDYKNHWNNKWVAYCDLIGFAEMCLNSNDTTVNAIIRFHRAVTKARSGLDSCKVYQFTDAAFCVADNPYDVLQFAISLANYSLAHNAITINGKQTPIFQHLIIPRITIASGQILTLENINNASLLSGLNKDSFLAGSAIIKAYRMENLTYAGALAIDGADFFSLLENLTVRGHDCAIKKAMQKWLKKFKNKIPCTVPSIVEIPWVYLASSAANGEFWTETKPSFLSKISTLIDISDRMTGSFVTLNSSISFGKHQVGLQRYIFSLLCEILGQKKFDLNRYRNPREFLNDL